MTKLYGQLIGLPWFVESSYARVRAMMADADNLPASYDVWREGAEQGEKNTRGDGIATTRVHLDGNLLIEFIEWCRVRDLPLDGKARHRFAKAFTVRSTKANLPDYDNPLFRHGAKHRKRKR